MDKGNPQFITIGRMEEVKGYDRLKLIAISLKILEKYKAGALQWAENFSSEVYKNKLIKLFE